MTSTLFAAHDIVLIDDVQKKFSDIESVPDARIVETFEVDEEPTSLPQEESYVVEQSHETENANITDIESLPDATVVEIEEEILPSENSIEESQTISAPNPVSEALCESTENVVVEETNCTVEETPVTEATCPAEPELILTSEPVAEQLQNDQNQTPITIVKTITKGKKYKQEIDFWKLLDETLLNSTKLILKKYDIAISKENIELVKNEYYPNLSISYAGEYYHSFEKGSSASIGGSFYPSFSQYRDSLGVTMQYELYRFGATDLKIEISHKELEIIRSELALLEERVSKQLLDYFTQALKAQESIKYKEKIHLVQDTILQKKYRLYEAGKAAKTEILKVEQGLVLLDKEILQYKLNYREAVKNIEILSNISLDPSNVEFLMFEPKNCPVKSFEESVQAKNLQLQIEVKRQELELIEKDYLPVVYMDSGYRLYGADENDFFKSVSNIRRNSWDVGVTVNWNFFSGYKTDNTIIKKKIELQKLIEKYRLAKIDFESQEKKRELLKKTFDSILQNESKIIDQTFQQEEVYTRLQAAGKADTIQLDYIKADILSSELSFRLNVIDKVYQTISSELII